MISVIIAAGIALFVSLFGMPLFIRLAHRLEWGQFIREDGPKTHLTKRGTPTMGGIVIILATVVAYLGGKALTDTTPSATGMLILMLMVGMGAIGFVDDYIKVHNHRSLGLTPAAKLIGQLAVTALFAWGVLIFPDAEGVTPGSGHISFLRDLPIDLFTWGVVPGAILFFIWVYGIVAGFSNAVNLTDGLDGLAAGVGILSFGAYGALAFWQFNQDCQRAVTPEIGQCYEVRDPLDVLMIVIAIVASLIGFLWWNTSPAQIFMGDTGSLALGGAFAAVAIVTRTEILSVIIGGVFVVALLSSLIQIGYFKISGGRRVFLMAPLHHHFELKGWAQVTVVVRFWILAGILAAAGLAIFYAQWVVTTR
ncbi:phospho-N-acetylmuramoyl-pentapeptide-transferase [Pseudoclavibacter soli]|uniref:phospho-N-acetylmuramoyl-pentapeptide- transferase n=1 Tax=Pseudoclavibacter soli TaxID=452623 RepID=UPI00040E5550|nr:phospho-N-acetylmuramoyl-pentapeptide-transferase [Pseudoclavibacter soli]